MSQNIAIASNKIGDYNEAILAATNAIKIDEKAEKALFQRSLAHLKKKEYDQAQADCKALVTINPKDKAYRDHWELIKSEKQKERQGQQAAMSKMFSEGLYNEKTVNISKEKKNSALPKFN